MYKLVEEAVKDFMRQEIGEKNMIETLGPVNKKVEAKIDESPSAKTKTTGSQETLDRAEDLLVFSEGLADWIEKKLAPIMLAADVAPPNEIEKIENLGELTDNEKEMPPLFRVLCGKFDRIRDRLKVIEDVLDRCDL